MATPPAIVWFRHNLRLADNPALHHAADRGGPVVALYVWSPDEESPWSPGAASRVWLHHSLERLDVALRRLGTPLIIRHGPAAPAIEALCAATGADAVFWNRCYEPQAVRRDTGVKAALRHAGVEARSFGGALLTEPMSVRNRQGKPFRVFTPFWKHCQTLETPRRPLPAPSRLAAPGVEPDGATLATLQLLPKIDWDAGIRRHWKVGEQAAHARLESFIDAAVRDYDTGRDLPGRDGVSRLSPHLHFGELSGNQIWHAVRDAVPDGDGAAYLRQLYWRDFAHHLLYHFPRTPDRCLNPAFDDFPWQTGRTDQVRAWERGETGYPLVDAGMRELWHTGWMHNRVRMNVGSLLVKHLLCHWRLGATWFWDTLVDADLANNTMGWQWIAGCGADAAPYFRIFNPVLQAQRFDADGAYVRRWVPELARLPDRFLHAPWTAPARVLEDSGVTLDSHYPRPIIDHAEGRARALAALKRAGS